ncbi:MAG TPA: hypothetical protein VJK51_01070 [Candidatus Nanoarchaeia archaeon]|nr:hypothetical protein [Candidatus Nanoarchaeia archaeon]
MTDKKTKITIQHTREDPSSIKITQVRSIAQLNRLKSGEVVKVNGILQVYVDKFDNGEYRFAYGTNGEDVSSTTVSPRYLDREFSGSGHFRFTETGGIDSTSYTEDLSQLVRKEVEPLLKQARLIQ